MMSVAEGELHLLAQLPASGPRCTKCIEDGCSTPTSTRDPTLQDAHRDSARLEILEQPGRRRHPSDRRAVPSIFPPFQQPPRASEPERLAPAPRGGLPAFEPAHHPNTSRPASAATEFPPLSPTSPVQPRYSHPAGSPQPRRSRPPRPSPAPQGAS